VSINALLKYTCGEVVSDKEDEIIALNTVKASCLLVMKMQ
jgi:hypothetical protein